VVVVVVMVMVVVVVMLADWMYSHNHCFVAQRRCSAPSPPVVPLSMPSVPALVPGLVSHARPWWRDGM
jgi:hypothetical protein